MQRSTPRSLRAVRERAQKRSAGAAWASKPCHRPETYSCKSPQFCTPAHPMRFRSRLLASSVNRQRCQRMHRSVVASEALRAPRTVVDGPLPRPLPPSPRVRSSSSARSSQVAFSSPPLLSAACLLLLVPSSARECAPFLGDAGQNLSPISDLPRNSIVMLSRTFGNLKWSPTALCKISSVSRIVRCALHRGRRILARSRRKDATLSASMVSVRACRVAPCPILDPSVTSRQPPRRRLHGTTTSPDRPALT